MQTVELEGGTFGASTNNLWTRYTVQAPAYMSSQAVSGLIDHIAHPRIVPADIPLEAGAISSERQKASRWYPATTALGYHCIALWKSAVQTSKRQTFGDDEDLAALTPERIAKLQGAYLDPGAVFSVGGTFDEVALVRELAALATKPHGLRSNLRPLQWRNAEYHETSFSAVGRFVYHLGGVIPLPSIRDAIGIMFIGKLLTNPTHGTLYQWLRDERGWSYDMTFTLNNGAASNGTHWELALPVATHEQARVVRAEVRERIERSIRDEARVAKEAKRRLGGLVFGYQTLGSILEDAEGALLRYGRVIPESEMRACLEACRDTAFLETVYEKYFSPAVTGEFLAMPKA